MLLASLFLFASVAAWFATMLLPGLSDLMIVTIPMVLVSLVLLLRAQRRRGRAVPKWILIDGSNVLYWLDKTPRIEPLRAVIAELEVRGFTPGVVFDANAGYLVAGRYQHDGALGRQLGLPEDRVLVAPKGTPADTLLLQAARDLGARIVTNDRYRDWAEAHPEVREPGFLVRGGYQDGVLTLDLADTRA